MYHPASIEPKWQKFWATHATFAALNPPFSGVAPKKAYILDMFPYPSGTGLHVGHPKGYTATDVYSRFLAANGYNVLHPMGWDAFGLPAENYAVKTGQHPRVTTEQNVAVFTRQIKELGLSYDWSREINTTDPEYYRWSQWIFSRLMERGLAYEAEKPVNWCPALKCVLANEEIVNGKSEVGGHPVEQRNMRQWVLRITEYAERLLADIDTVDWPEGIKEQQRNWIGKSEGCEFALLGDRGSISVYTTRVDTVYGMKWVVIAPDHSQVSSFVTADHQGACDEYIVAARAKSDQDRTNGGLEKTGVFTGSSVVNPFNGESVPVWIADYVLGSYGTGAVMGVPAHDERDFEFAVKYGFEIKNVVFSNDEIHKTGFGYANHSFAINPSSPWDVWNNIHIYEAFLRNECSFTMYGTLRNSGEYSGMPSLQAIEKFTEIAESKGFGHKRTNYKLRDWIFSRQRYWGEPIPVIHLNTEDFAKLPAYTEGSIVPSIETDANKKYLRINGERYSEIFTTIDGPCILDPNLPLILPEVERYEPSDDGRSPLANVIDWVNTIIAPGLRGTRETNTMPQWAGSCWYYLRFMDPHNPEAIASKEALEYWGSVDHYVGGAEHAVLHLLYARFWHKVLYDLGVVPTLEPFQKLTNQGLILGPDGNKMSKSKGNVINPDDIVKEFGADVLRTYILSMADFKDPAPWDTKSMVGMQRFLERSEALFGDRPRLSSDEMRSMKLLHKTIKKVGEDIAAFKFNTAISALIILVNEGLPTDREFQTEWRTAFALLLHPFAPHLGEELWSKLGHTESIYRAPWPEFDAFMTIDDEVTIAIQVNGKLRGTKEFLNGVAAEEVISEAYSMPEINKWTEGKKVIREIFVPNKLLNIVVGE